MKTETDWLTTESVFYNEKTGAISNNINEVIDFNHFEWSYEGLYNYLDFGYSVFQQTPIKYIKFLDHSSVINLNNKKELILTQKEDPILNYNSLVSKETDVLDMIESKIQLWENNVNGKIIIPTSGGYDSRLLNYFIKDKKRIVSFTYGISNNQKNSFEVVYANEIAKRLHTEWHQIKLGKYHNYINDWYKIYGVSTHAHGMYHMEFYHLIQAKYNMFNIPFLSGIFGDIWAGSVKNIKINLPQDLIKLSYSHGMNADVSQLQLPKKELEQKLSFYESNKSKLNDTFFQTVFLIRFKIILINYLLNIPSHFSFKPYSPFIDIDVALGMLTLPQKRRENRKWQTEFFEKYNLNIEQQIKHYSKENTLNIQASKIVSLPPLSENLLSEIINPEYVKWINNNTLQKKHQKHYYTLYNKISNIKYVNRILNAPKYNKSAYCAYLTLYPLQKLIEQRNAYFKSK